MNEVRGDLPSLELTAGPSKYTIPKGNLIFQPSISRRTHCKLLLSPRVAQQQLPGVIVYPVSLLSFIGDFH